LSQIFLCKLYKHYWPELFGKLRRRFGNGPPDPEDIAQLAFIKYSEMVSKDPIENPKAFIYTIARNLVIDSLRRENKQEKMIDEIFQELNIAALDEQSAEHDALDSERISLIEDAMAKLPAKQKSFIMASCVEGLSYRTIAKQTGHSLSDISRTIEKAYVAISAELLNEEEDKQAEYSVPSKMRKLQ
jgi:RNA polymerase sigma factor (sigma-70 family)